MCEQDNIGASAVDECPFLAHHDMLHCGGRPSLTGHCGHGWTCHYGPHFPFKLRDDFRTLSCNFRYNHRTALGYSVRHFQYRTRLASVSRTGGLTNPDYSKATARFLFPALAAKELEAAQAQREAHLSALKHGEETPMADDGEQWKSLHRKALFTNVGLALSH